MLIRIELNERQLRELVADHLRDILGDVKLDLNMLDIQVKSKQNYRSEWEKASFKAVYESNS